MSAARAFTLHAGPRAAAHVHKEGLRPQHVACVPAAAGGPKGLALVPLDKWLFGDWLAGSSRVEQVGASIGAWRMYAAAQRDAVPALERLAEGYLSQRFPHRATPQQVAAECRRFVRTILEGTRLDTLRPGARLSVITARARGVLHGASSRSAFARAALANTWSRPRLAAHMERVVFTAGGSAFPAERFDAFGLSRIGFTQDNLEDALLASGSIPLVCEPVRNPAGAPRGDYWDGGLIDYHLLLPYRMLEGLVLYPHFVTHVTPGWLDKFLPWRARPRSHPWLDNVLLVAPSRALLERLPNRKLPDRNDFYRYARADEQRMRDWRRALGECQRFADEVATWISNPDPTLLQPL
ncbi:MAG TPA: patatin-like phospholipase family protein [Burkholderiaceae bacterium]|nr:patatin-like phospholipase family protein [Burkholderiaceae bacterium]